MKQNWVFVFGLLISHFIYAGGDVPAVDEAPIVHVVDATDSLKIKGTMHLSVEGREDALQVEIKILGGKKELRNNAQLSTKGGEIKLKLEQEKPWLQWFSSDLTSKDLPHVMISGPGFKEIEVSLKGQSTAHLLDLDCKELECSLSGKANLVYSGKIEKELEVDMSGNSVAKVSMGSTQSIECNLSGSSHLELSLESAEEMDANLSGSSLVQADLRELSKLDINASGSSRTQLKSGSIQKADLDASGSARIDCSGATIKEPEVDSSGSARILFDAEQ